MPFTLNGQPIQRARVTIPRHGVWEGEVSAAGPLVLADGAAVELVLGNVIFRGSVVPGTGGTFVDEASFTITGGNGWTKPVEEKGYSIPAGVPLASVAAALATAAGEQLDVTGADRILGDHWIRRAGPASLALWDLFPLERGGWRLDPDGVARPGPRPPAPLPVGLELALEAYNPAQRWARVSLPGDQVGALLPGAILTGPTLLAPIVVGTTTIHASSDSVTVELLGETGIVELFAALVQAVTPSRIFGGRWTYQVADADTGRPNLRALATVAGLPSLLAVDKVHGLPGVTSTLAPGALVLVEFRDGDPAKPVVSGFLGGTLPVSVLLDATTSISLGAAAVELAKGGIVDFNFGAIAGKLNTICAALSIAPLGGLSSTKTTKAKGE